MAIHGWLWNIGIDIRMSGIIEVADNLDLPYTRRKNNSIYVVRRDMARWVLMITGYEYAPWVARWDASDKKHPLHLTPKTSQGLLEPPAPMMFLLTIRVDGLEMPLRLMSGGAFLTANKLVAKSWPLYARDHAEKLLAFKTFRRTSPEDFLIQPADGAMEALIFPTIMRGGETQYIAVPGTLFDLEPRTWTPLIAPSQWAGWAAWREVVDHKNPDAAWSTWTGRTEYDRRLVQEILPRREAPPAPEGDPTG